MTAPQTGHIVQSIAFPHFRSGRPATIRCTCGDSIELAPDLAAPDPHQPILDAWREHRKQAGAGVPRILGQRGTFGGTFSPRAGRR